MNVWGCDWSLKTGVALAWRTTYGEIQTLRLGCGDGQNPPERLSNLYAVTGQAAAVPVELPTAVYFEQAFGSNMRMLQAQGVLQAALWDALVGRTPFPPNVWPLRTTEWRQVLGMVSPREGTSVERRAERKLQQKVYAIGLGADRGLSEDEFDAVCILRAGELDIGEQRSAA